MDDGEMHLIRFYRTTVSKIAQQQTPNACD